MNSPQVKIPVSRIYQTARQLAEDVNLSLPRDVLVALQRAYENEKKAPYSSGRVPLEILKAIIENARISRRERLPLCQDTGFVEAYLSIGSGVVVTRGEKDKGPYKAFLTASQAVAAGIRDAYIGNRFRFSMVSDPLTRKNTSDNTPSFIYIEEIPGSKNITLGIIAKGGGSENSSAIKFFTPSVKWADIENFIIETVRRKAPFACPPVIVSVALGGNFSAAPLAAKKIFLSRKIGSANPDPVYNRRENILLKKINSLGIGPMGLGGKTTALDVFITPIPTHIAMLPCAIVIQCHSLRVGRAVIR